MATTLRPYQQAAVKAVYEHLRTRDDNPAVVLPTAAGKSVVLAQIVADTVLRWNGRVLVLAHVKELLEQNAEKIRRLCPEVAIGLYSAGLNRREVDKPAIVAGIQSVYKRACELDAFDLVIVDECFVPGTRISTPSGDIPVEEIQPGMVVRNATGIGTVEAVAARRARNLVTLEYDDGTILTCTPNHPVFTESGWRAAGSLAVGSLALGIEGVRMLRKDISPMEQAASQWPPASPEGEVVDEATVLLDLLCEDSQQLHDISGDSAKGQPVPQSQGVCASHSWGQRSTHHPPTGDARALGSRVGGRVRCAGPQLQGRAPAEEPKDRHRSSQASDCSGAGWPQPPVARPQAPRLTQNAVFGTKRLVRLTHHQPAGGNVVFNLQVSGHPSYFANGVFVHNCHLIPEDGEGMYRTFLAEAKVVNPHLRVIGLTATPFRLSSGPICTPDGILNHICYEVGVRELIRDGYLCPLVTKAGRGKGDFERLHVRAGEFVADEVEDLMDDERLVAAACGEIVAYTHDRQSVLVFTSGVKHGKHVARVLAEMSGQEVGFLDGQTPAAERAELIARFRREPLPGDLFGRRLPPLKYLVNVNVLTTGFDAPNIDCVAILRPTMSPGLFYQMCGRGFRTHPGKANCLVLDFGGNALRHGPVDQLKLPDVPGRGSGEAPAKECPECHAVVAAGYARCPECGYEFPPPERQKHDARAGEAGVLSGQVTDTEYEVLDIRYSVHTKRDAPPDAPRSMRVEYRIGQFTRVSEWVCFEHGGYARWKAEQWWRRRSPDPVPETAERAVEIAEAGGVAWTEKIVVRTVAGEKYDRIVGYTLGPKPEPVPIEEAAGDLADVPF